MLPTRSRYRVQVEPSSLYSVLAKGPPWAVIQREPSGGDHELAGPACAIRVHARDPVGRVVRCQTARVDAGQGGRVRAHPERPVGCDPGRPLGIGDRGARVRLIWV